MTGYGKFRIIWWKWYIVDLRNWHKPVIVRKHLDSKKQAEKYKKDYFDRHYETVRGKEALEMNLKDWINYKKKHHHSQVFKSKWGEYPEHIKTQVQRKTWRGNRRRSMKSNKNKPKMTDKVLDEILQDKRTLFFKRLKKWKNYYQAYSKPVLGHQRFIEEYKWPVHVVKLSAIVLCLQEHYELGPHSVVDTAIYIYEGWPERVDKRLKGGSTSDKDPNEVLKEFKARGFVKERNSGYDNKCNYVASIHTDITYVYTKLAHLRYDQMALYEKNVYELLGLVGISGYTKAVCNTL
jgi:hypothetical protein